MLGTGTTRWRLFQLFGNDVYLTPSFLFILLIFVGFGVRTATDLAQGLVWVPILFISIVLHELGHALATRALKYGNSQIVLGGLGGLAINRSRRQRTSRDQILISLAGPAASAALAGVSYILWVSLGGGGGAYVELFWANMVAANIFWVVFNMLPIVPMDGGQALRAGLEIGTNDKRRAALTASYVSLIAIVVGTLALIAWRGVDLFLLLFAAYFGYMNWQVIQAAQSPRARRRA